MEWNRTGQHWVNESKSFVCCCCFELSTLPDVGIRELVTCFSFMYVFCLLLCRRLFVFVSLYVRELGVGKEIIERTFNRVQHLAHLCPIICNI